MTLSWPAITGPVILVPALFGAVLVAGVALVSIGLQDEFLGGIVMFERSGAESKSALTVLAEAAEE